MTNPEYAPDRDTNEQYLEHVADSLRANPWARVIRASDFTDNGVGLIHTTGPRLQKLAGKYAPLVPVLQELIARPDTPLDAPARQHILAQLDRAADRFAAVLPVEATVRRPRLTFTPGTRHGPFGINGPAAASGSGRPR